MFTEFYELFHELLSEYLFLVQHFPLVMTQVECPVVFVEP